MTASRQNGMRQSHSTLSGIAARPLAILLQLLLAATLLLSAPLVGATEEAPAETAVTEEETPTETDPASAPAVSAPSEEKREGSLPDIGDIGLGCAADD